MLHYTLPFSYSAYGFTPFWCVIEHSSFHRAGENYPNGSSKEYWVEVALSLCCMKILLDKNLPLLDTRYRPTMDLVMQRALKNPWPHDFPLPSISHRGIQSCAEPTYSCSPRWEALMSPPKSWMPLVKRSMLFPESSHPLLIILLCNISLMYDIKQTSTYPAFRTTALILLSCSRFLKKLNGTYKAFLPQRNLVCLLSTCLLSLNSMDLLMFDFCWG